MNMTSFPRLLVRSHRAQSFHIALLWLLIGLMVPSAYGARNIQPQPGPVPLSSAGKIFGQARVEVSSLNVRTGPHISYTAVAYLMEGERVTLTGRNRPGTWVQIRLYNGYRGWINAAYLRTNIPIDALPVVDVSLLGITGFVTNDPVPVYTGPGLVFPLAGRALPGEVLTFSGRDASARWLYVRLPDGQTGWAAADSSFLPWGALADLPILYPFHDTSAVDLSPFFLAYSGPGFLYAPLATITIGQAVDITGRTADSYWIQVRLPDGREGWLAAEILHIEGATADIPIVDSGVAPPQVVSWMPSVATTNAAGGRPMIGKTTATPTEKPEETTVAATTPLATSPAPATGIPTGTATPEAPGAGESTEEVPATPRPPIPVIYVYAAPDETSAPILRVVPGQRVVLIGRTSDATWLKIWLEGDLEGWLRADTLKLDVDVQVLPVLEF